MLGVLSAKIRIAVIFWLLHLHKADGLYFSMSRGQTELHDHVNFDWNVPADGKMVFHSVATCGPSPPVYLLAKQALLCEHAKTMQECMGLAPGAPSMIGRYEWLIHHCVIYYTADHHIYMRQDIASSQP